MDEWGVTHHRMIFWTLLLVKRDGEECRLLEICRKGEGTNEGEIKDGASYRNTERVSVRTIV